MLTPSDCECGHAHGEHEHEEDDEQPLSLAHQLWHPFRLIALNPLPVLVVFVIANTVFVTLGALLRLLAHLLTIPGLLLMLLLAVVLGIRRVASLMAYPGQLKLVIREGEANFARLTKRRLQIFAEAAADLAVVLDPNASSGFQRLRFLQAHQNFSFALETLMMPVLQSLEIVERDGNLRANGVKLLKALREVVKVNSTKLAEPCSKLCSASEKSFETLRVKLFEDAKAAQAEPSPPKAETPKLKFFGGATKPSIKRSKTMDSASLEAEAAAKPKQITSVHPVIAFAAAVHRLKGMIPLIGRPQSDTPASRNISWIAKELCRGSAPEEDYIATLEMLRADMAVRFKGEQVWIPGYQGHQIDAMLMPPAASGRDAVDRPVVMLCNPNGGLYEFHHLQMDWIKFYTTDLDFHVLVYNYRGYGRCKGSPDPALHNLDGLAIVNYLTSERGLKRVAVHGESIGGLVATYLAKKSPHVTVLIADRTFASVPALAQRMIAGWAGTVVNWVMRWETDNVQNYLDATCSKLLCSDPCDEIILDGASLKSGIALSRELGDTDFSLPRQRKSDGAPASPASPKTFVGSLWARLRSPRGTRRVSEAASRPQLGQPLTETMVARFSDAVLSVGRRAMEYTSRDDADAANVAHEKKPDGTDSSHVTLQVEDSEGSLSAAPEDSEHHPMLSTDAITPAPVTTSAAFPNELLAVVWMQLARLDGYCGQCVLQAAESGGYDKIRAWTASLLTWGGRVAPEHRNTATLEPFDRDGIVIVPIMVAEVHATLQHLVEKHPSIKFDYDIGFIVLMIEYLYDALQRRWREMDSSSANPAASASGDRKQPGAVQSNVKDVPSEPPLLIKTGDPQLGCLLPLHCGHNKNYEDPERQALVGFLRHVGFLEKAKPSASK